MLRLDPRHIDAHYGMMIYFRKYLAQEREAGLPTHAVANWRLGLVFERQGRKPEAISAIESAVRAEPSLEPAKKDLKRLKG